MPDVAPGSDDDARLSALEKRIAAAKANRAPKQDKPHGDEHYAQVSLAWRMVIELVAGLAIGFGIGYGLDVLFGTLPIFLVLFILLGLAAGIRVMLRSAQEVAKQELAKSAGEDEGV